MRRDYLILTTAEIEKYLAGSKNIDKSKDYELGLALILIKFHTKETGEKLKVALPAKESLTKDENIVEVLRNKIEEDHDIDVYLIPEDLDLSSRGKHKASAFQLKKFFLTKKKGVANLLEYLTSKIPKKYTPGGSGVLALLMRGEISISKDEFEQINSALKAIPQYPFERVMFIAGKDGERIVFGNLFPEWGHKTYTHAERFLDRFPDV